MRKFGLIVRALAAGAFIFGIFAQSALAVATFTPPGRILQLVGGWGDPNLRIMMEGTFHNPAGCALTDGYMVAATLPAIQQFTAMAIAAHAQQQKVILTIEGCALDRPRVVGFTYGNIN
jgi:hypothetical protein